MSVTNLQIAELLGRRADEADGHRRRAYGRASSAALMWPEEAAAVAARSESLETLPGVGPSLARRITDWLDDPGELLEPPPVRRGFRSYASALQSLDPHSEWSRELRGDLQMHSTYSDGKATLRDMALAAADRGYDYISITDHSQGLKVARGMDEAELARQGHEVDRLNESLAAEGIELRVLRGIEMNLDKEGAGDMEPQSLEPLDLVVGSFHSNLRSTEDETDRYLGALANPLINILGHPTTRRFSRRAGLRAEWPRIFEAAASSGVALEINSHPHRQDIYPELLRLGKDSGALFSIGTDAHSTGELAYVGLSLAASQDAGIERERIINFWELDRLLGWAGARAGR
ncbi:MAG: PHP domain-containing protein [Actinomycetota bacterium]|nr:PHP domain-containing protein [Actinomycetota bacterium]